MSRIKIYDPNAANPGEVCADSRSVNGLNAAGIVVCRLDSSRLPGKVLRMVQGRPLLKWVIDRTTQVQRFDQGVIVATSDRTIDDPIFEFCRLHQIKVFRGSADDVAGRMLECAQSYNLDWFARINADSPFVDSQLLNTACEVAESGKYDFVTNLSPRSFPYGVSAELIRTELFSQAYTEMSSPDHFEHVTKIFYEADSPVSYRKYNLLNPELNQSQIRLTVDTPEDWQLFCRLTEMAQKQNTDLSFQKAIQLIQPFREAA